MRINRNDFSTDLCVGILFKKKKSTLNIHKVLSLLSSIVDSLISKSTNAPNAVIRYFVNRKSQYMFREFHNLNGVFVYFLFQQ